MNTCDNPCEIIMTVGDERQKAICEQLLIKYKMKDQISLLCDSPDSRRLGNGGAFLRALDSFGTYCKKMIIINAGGFSKRSFCYALEGKALIETADKNGKVVLLIETILSHAKRFAQRFSQGVLVICGDIPVAYEEIPLDFQENIGFCISERIEKAANHGVMIPDQDGYLKHYLHKQDRETLKQFGSFLPVDTGMLFLTCETALFLKEHFGIQRSNRELSLYADILPCFEETTKATSCRKSTTMTPLHLRVCLLKQPFFHFGTTEEIKQNILYDLDAAIAINSIISSETVIRPGSLAVHCRIGGNSIIGRNCIIKNVEATDLYVPDHLCVCSLPMQDGSVIAVITPINENPKMLENEEELWKKKRFYKGRTFEESYTLYFDESEQERFSMEDCFAGVSIERYLKQQVRFFNRTCFSRKETPYTALRNDILQEHLQTHHVLRWIECLEDDVTVDLPLRINLAGTWSDAMPYCVLFGGSMVNAAVLVENTFPIHIRAYRTQDQVIVFTNNNMRIESDLHALFSEPPDGFLIFVKALQAMGVRATTKLEFGFHLEIQTVELDRGSGLGLSSILMAGIIKACSKLFGLSVADEELIHLVFIAEQMLGTGGGWQDQVGALYPGVKAFSSQAGLHQAIALEPIPISTQLRKALTERLVLIPTGISHDGETIVKDVADRVLRGNQETLQAIFENKELCRKIKTALLHDQYDAFCACVNAHNELLKKISPKIWNTELNTIALQVARFCDGITILGAGGGGYFLGILKKCAAISSLRECFHASFPTVRSQIYQIQVVI